LFTRCRSGKAGLTALLCDGIACDGFIWRFLYDDLLAAANVVHWNYRGHGRSAAPVDDACVDMSVFIDDLNTVRSEIIAEPCVLFGHSMGCQIALGGLHDNPEGVAGLVLICGAAGRITHSFKGTSALAQALPPLIDRARKFPQLTRALWSHVPAELAARIALAAGEVDAKTIDPNDLVKYSEHVSNMDPLLFMRMLQTVGEESAEEWLPTIDVPVLVIAGELDSFTPPHLAEKMAARIPNSELVVISGATHVAPIERRALVQEHVTSFIEKRIRPTLVQAEPVP
jgi:pimeloyl-ACP methyl ester carboxylesterase